MQARTCHRPASMAVKKTYSDREVEYHLYEGEEMVARLVVDFDDSEKMARLEYLRAFYKGKGHGTSVMKNALADIDDARYKARVYAVSDDVEGLKYNVEWYKRFGFYPVDEVVEDGKRVVGIEVDRVECDPLGHVTLFKGLEKVSRYDDEHGVRMYRDAMKADLP